jgi:hypothetical protein
MKNVLIALCAVLFLAACGTKNGDEPQTIPADRLTQNEAPNAFHGLGIRYDGYYKEEDRGVIYLIRFFPQGNAVLINGTPDMAHVLPGQLTADALGDPVVGWYNVPVTVREDSIFFRTYPEKGEISYRGNVPSTSMVRLLRHSHINGSRTIKEYLFQPDKKTGQQAGQQDPLKEYKLPLLIGIAIIVVLILLRMFVLVRRGNRKD